LRKGDFATGKEKANFFLEEAMRAQRAVEVQLYSLFNIRARWGGWATPRPGRFTPGKETRYPFYGR